MREQASRILDMASSFRHDLRQLHFANCSGSLLQYMRFLALSARLQAAATRPTHLTENGPASKEYRGFSLVNKNMRSMKQEALRARKCGSRSSQEHWCLSWRFFAFYTGSLHHLGGSLELHGGIGTGFADPRHHKLGREEFGSLCLCHVSCSRSS